VLVSQFTPAGLEELAHAVACLANGRIVLVKHLAIIEDLTHVHAEVLTGFVAIQKKCSTSEFMIL